MFLTDCRDGLILTIEEEGRAPIRIEVKRRSPRLPGLKLGVVAEDSVKIRVSRMEEVRR